MDLTKNKLKKLIREEYKKLISEIKGSGLGPRSKPFSSTSPSRYKLKRRPRHAGQEEWSDEYRHLKNIFKFLRKNKRKEPYQRISLPGKGEKLEIKYRSKSNPITMYVDSENGDALVYSINGEKGRIPRMDDDNYESDKKQAEKIKEMFRERVGD